MATRLSFFGRPDRGNAFRMRFEEKQARSKGPKLSTECILPRTEFYGYRHDGVAISGNLHGKQEVVVGITTHGSQVDRRKHRDRPSYEC